MAEIRAAPAEEGAEEGAEIDDRARDRVFAAIQASMRISSWVSMGGSFRVQPGRATRREFHGRLRIASKGGKLMWAASSRGTMRRSAGPPPRSGRPAASR